jgi:hypothetical protein
VVSGGHGQTELEQFAKQFTDERLRALEKDVAHCLTQPCAPFSAIVFNLSTIDLLGALVAGDASPNAPTTAQSAAYLEQYMNYTPDEAKLLQGLFRHKLVHLAQPKAVFRHNGKVVTWRYWHDDAGKHRQLTNFSSPVVEAVTSGLSLTIEQEFSIGITQLVREVVESVRLAGGYLDKLKGNATLQAHFATAISQIYSP